MKKLFCISGLGADQRVFQYLKIKNIELIAVEWLQPFQKESIKNYAARLVKKYRINQEENFGLIGVSFGGLIAVEIAKITKPKFIFSISSITTQKEKPFLLKIFKYFDFTPLLPSFFFKPPKIIFHFFMGARKKKLLNSILEDTDFIFAKWAVHELVQWKNETIINNLYKINGSRDKLLPSKGKKDILIQGGEHFMIVDRADEISVIINHKIKKLG